MEKSFVARNLRKSVSYTDLRKNTDLHNKAKLQACAKKAAILVDDKAIFINSLNSITVKGKQAFTINDTSVQLVIKLLSRNIKSTYNILVKSREEITATLVSFLKESSPYHIHRFDIKSFYESFDRSEIISKLKRDCLISKKNLDLLTLFFKELESRNVTGLPRGIGLSAILSEVMMKESDNSTKNMNGVFFFARFVDDMIIITDDKLAKETMIDDITKSVPSNLKLHTKGDKIFFGKISKTRNKGTPESCNFNYLGYQYTSNTNQSETDRFLQIPRRKVSIDISDEKVKKIKNRLIKTFSCYISSSKTKNDYTLLLNRIKFLTGNYNLINTSNINNVRSGIYYNYNLINQDRQLKNIDNFMRGLLFSKRYRLSVRIQNNLSPKVRKDLSHFSFYKGHKLRRFHKFSYKDFMQIKRSWL